MRRRERPEPAGPPPPDRAKVAYLLNRANAARERGEIMHQHPTLLALEKVCDSIAAYHVFIRYPDDYKLTAAELAELVDGLVRREAP